MKKSLPNEAVAFPESPRLTRRHLFIALATIAAAPLAVLAQKQPAAAIRGKSLVRSLAGAGNDVVIEIVSEAPFIVGSSAWILRIGKNEFRDYNYGRKGELTVLQFRVPEAQYSRLASGQAASVHYGDVSRPGRSLGKFVRSAPSR